MSQLLTIYRDVSPVGKSSFGKVFRGRFEDIIDVSIVRIEKSETLIDIKLLRTVDKHPNIARFYDSEDDGTEFMKIGTELCSCTLKAFISGDCKEFPVGGFAELRATEILHQITSAVEYLHSNNICHRNLNPSNILISRPDGTLYPRIKLTDFAFTRVSATASLPLWKRVGANKSWVAPEIYDCYTFDLAMDVFPLGILFAYVLSGGVHPFGVDKEDRIFNIKKKHPMSFTIQHLNDVVGAADVFDLICSMLSFDPEERPTASVVLNVIGILTSESCDSKSKAEKELTDIQSKDDQPYNDVENAVISDRLPSEEPPAKKLRQEEATRQQLSFPSSSSALPVEMITGEVLTPVSSPKKNQTSLLDARLLLETERGKYFSAAISVADFNSPDSTFTPVLPDRPGTWSSFLNLTEPFLSSPLSEEENRSPPPPLVTLSDVMQPSTLNSHPDSSSTSHTSQSQWGQRLMQWENQFDSPVEWTLIEIDVPDISPKCREKIHLSKVKELSNLCSQRNLDEVNLTRLHQLIADKQICIDYQFKASAPIVLLCQDNNNRHLYRTLEIFLQRDDLDINATSPYGFNALMFLCLLHRHEDLINCVQLLVNRGINAEAKGKEGENALQLLCQNYDGKNLRDIATVLINHSTSLDDISKCVGILRNRKLYSPLKTISKILQHIRNGHSHKEAKLLELCSRPFLNKRTVDRLRGLVSDEEVNLHCTEAKTGRTPMLLLLHNNQNDYLFKQIQFLLKSNKVDIYAKDNDNCDALLTACCRYGGKQLFEIVNLLLSWGIPVNNSSQLCTNALFALTRNDNNKNIDNRLLKIVKILVKCGLNCNAKTNDGLNVLVPFTRRYYDHPDLAKIIRVLVKNGLDLNVTNLAGKPAFLILCQTLTGDCNIGEEELVSIVQFLIKCGINAHVKDGRGVDALSILRQRGYQQDSKIVQFLLRY